MTDFEKSLNDLQVSSLRELRAGLHGAHFVNIEIRKGGVYYYYEADWLRDALNRLCSDETS